MKQNQKHTLIVLLCLVTLVALCLTFAACNKTYSVKIANYDKAQGSVTLSPESQDGQYKEGTELTVTVKPVDGYAVESFKLGSEEKVGELNSEGKFVFKVQQDATITVTFKSTTVAVESVSLNKQSLSVHVTKQDDTLTAQVLPENATDKTVTWTSSVPAVATVDNNGKITAVAAGETVITATAGDGKTATCTVTVTDHQLTTVSAGENGHKSVCGVDGCGYESEVSAHSLKINSDKTKFECEQCEYEVAHTHSLSYKSTGSEQHTVSCTVEGCGYTSTAKHSLKINSDKTKFECEQCEYEVAHSHDLETKSAGANGHKEVCKTEGCGYEGAVSAHSLKINSDKTKFECEQCEYEVAHTHTLSYKSTGSEQHTVSCTVEGCGYTSTANHSLKINSDKTKFECEQCEYEVAHSHDINVESAGVSGHKSVCQTEGCGYESAVSAHSLKINSDKTKFECEQCDYEENHTHTYKIVSDAEQGHHQECENEQCGFVGETVAHQFNDEYYSDGSAGHHQECSVEGCGYHTQTVQHTLTNWEISTENRGWHESYCDDCDEKVTESHTLVVSSSTATEETVACDKCTYEYSRDHKLKWVQDDDGKCHQECENTFPRCNYKTEAKPHDMQWNMLDNPAEGHSGVCKNGCGYVVEQEEHDKLGEGGACSKCGYVDAGEHVCIEHVIADSNGFYDGECQICHLNAIFEINSDGIITTFKDYSTLIQNSELKIKVPATVNGSPVKGFSAGSSSTGSLFGTELTDIVIAENSELTALPNYLFAKCTKLKSIVVLASIQTIGIMPCYNCTSLQYIVLPNTIKTVGTRFFGVSGPLTLTNIYFMGTKEEYDLIKSNLNSGDSATVLYSGEWTWTDDTQDVPKANN